MGFGRVEYMRWAKAVPGGAAFRLSASGVLPPPLEWLGEPPSWEELRAGADEGYGKRAVAEAIADAYGVDPRGVVFTGGTSEANFLVLAALLEPGDRVVVETPVYEPLVAAVRALGARPVWLRRRPQERFAVDVDALRRLLGPGVRAVLLTRLHNPSGVDLAPGTLEAAAEACREAGATLVVDEVYRDFLGEGASPVAATLGEGVVTTSSLTKVHGLGGLRAGWVLCQPRLAARIHDVRDHLEVVAPAPVLALALRGLARRDALVERAREQSAMGIPRVRALVEARPGISWVEPDGGICCALRLPPGVDDRDFAARMKEERDTVVVPGSFFDLPGWIRVGWAEDPGHTDEALRRLGEVLDAAGAGGVRSSR